MSSPFPVLVRPSWEERPSGTPPPVPVVGRLELLLRSRLGFSSGRLRRVGCREGKVYPWGVDHDPLRRFCGRRRRGQGYFS
jgi:hypothetical protein